MINATISVTEEGAMPILRSVRHFQKQNFQNNAQNENHKVTCSKLEKLIKKNIPKTKISKQQSK